MNLRTLLRQHARRLWAVIAALAPASALACECASSPLLSRLAGSDAVFLGEVVAHRPQVSLELRVIEAYKDAQTPTVTIQTGSKSLCDYLFKPAETHAGDRYLVYMTSGPDGNRINRCLGTAPATAVPDEIETLRGWRGM